MKQQHLVISLFLFFSGYMASHAERLIFPFLKPESQSNIIVTANWEHPLPCPSEYTNLISNTNLFTPAEQRLIKEIPLKYQYVTTNSGPAGTVFKGVKLRKRNFGEFSRTFQVSCFVYTNSSAQEEIAFMEPRQIIASFRTQSGDGYDVNLIDGRLSQIQAYKNGALDGLWVGMIFDADHCNELAHFVKGKIIGRFIGWDHDGVIRVEAEFREPFDYLKGEIGKFELAWTEASTNTINSGLNSP